LKSLKDFGFVAGQLLSGSLCSIARVDCCTALHQTIAVVAAIGVCHYSHLDQGDLGQHTAIPAESPDGKHLMSAFDGAAGGRAGDKNLFDGPDDGSEIH
jgi:hypothetical protein